jgi:5-methylcytosine-specific restriction endonuclease McrA
MAGRKAGQGSKWIRKTTRARIYARDGHACVYCGAHVTDGIVLSLDHVVACELGGTNHPSNLVTCCLSCNSAKQHSTLAAFVATLADRGQSAKRVARRVRNARRRVLPRLSATEMAALR